MGYIVGFTAVGAGSGPSTSHQWHRILLQPTTKKCGSTGCQCQRGQVVSSEFR